MKKISLKNVRATIGSLTITPPSQQINVLRSPLYWPGRKEKLIPQLFELFPKSFEVFHDVFCGSGDVAYNVQLHYKNGSLPDGRLHIHLNDKLNEVILVHKLLCLEFDGVEFRLKELYDKFFTPDENLTEKEQWTIFREWYNTTPIEETKEVGFNAPFISESEMLRATANLLLSALCFSNSPTWSYPTKQTRIPHAEGQLYFNQAFGRLAPFPKLIETAKDFKEAMMTMLSRSADFSRLSSHQYIEALPNVEKGKHLVYLDCPYWGSSAGYTRGNAVPWSLEEEEELYQDLSLLDERGYLFAFSNDIGINTRLAEWIETDKPERFNVFTMKKSYAGKITGNRRDIPTKEVLITNYEVE